MGSDVIQQDKRNSQRDDHDVQQPKQIGEPQFKAVVSTLRKQQAGLQREERSDDMGHPVGDSKSERQQTERGLDQKSRAKNTRSPWVSSNSSCGAFANTRLIGGKNSMAAATTATAERTMAKNAMPLILSEKK